MVYLYMDIYVTKTFDIPKVISYRQIIFHTRSSKEHYIKHNVNIRNDQTLPTFPKKLIWEQKHVSHGNTSPGMLYFYFLRYRPGGHWRTTQHPGNDRCPGLAPRDQTVVPTRLAPPSPWKPRKFKMSLFCIYNKTFILNSTDITRVWLIKFILFFTISFTSEYIRHQHLFFSGK